MTLRLDMGTHVNLDDGTQFSQIYDLLDAVASPDDHVVLTEVVEELVGRRIL